jgi:RNA polymerase sigma-70 factor (ECF subfamily)
MASTDGPDDSTTSDSAVRRALVESHRTLLAYLQRRFGNGAEAEEVLQLFMVRALEREAALREEDSVRGWLGRVLASTIVDHQRRAISKRSREADLEPQLLENIAEETGGEIDQAVCACLHALLPSLRSDQAELIRRADLSDEPRETIAASLGVTLNALGVRLHRARQALKARLEAMCLTCPVHGFLDCGCEHARRMRAVRTAAEGRTVPGVAMPPQP